MIISFIHKHKPFPWQSYLRFDPSEDQDSNVEMFNGMNGSLFYRHLSLSVSFPILSSLQAYEETYTEPEYESYDSYYSQPQA